MKAKVVMVLGVIACVSLAFASSALGRPQPLGTAFTYQGALKNGGNAYSGTADFQFALYDGSGGGATQIGSTLAVLAASVTDGMFTASLDFGAVAFDGNDRWLEIRVTAPGNGGVGPYTALSPRQRLTAAPYALYALNGGNATQLGGQTAAFYQNAANLNTGTIPAARLGGTYANALTLSNASNSVSGTFTGSGAGLTNLSWSSLAGVPAGFADGIDNDSNPWLVSGSTVYYTAGNVGIGTNTPSNKLSVVGNADFNGNVGIGTASPTSRLTVANGNAEFAFAVGIGTGSPSNRLSVAGGADFSGNVGIGLTNPFWPLDVRSGSTFSNAEAIHAEMTSGGNGTAAVRGINYGAGPSFGVVGDHRGNGFGVLGVSAAGTGVYGDSSGSIGSGVYGRNVSGGFAGYFDGPRSSFTGSVGIGTDTPANRLTVIGSADFTGSIGLGTTTPANRLTVVGNADFTGNVGIGTNTPTNKLTVTGGNANFTGNVGIGITPPAWPLDVRTASTTPINGIYSELSSGNAGALSSAIRAVNNGTTNFGYGVYVQVQGSSLGVSSRSVSGAGVHGQVTGASGMGVLGEAIGVSVNYGVRGYSGSPTGYGVYSEGNMHVTGTLSKAGGAFRIDHPLDPQNKELWHSFVESPDMMNIYNGNARSDGAGYAVITLPDYFEALNREFRYQVTVIDDVDNDHFVMVKVVRRIEGNQFTIRTSVPFVDVSWQVTGVRKDAWAESNRIPNEVEKRQEDKGLYLNPEAFGQPPQMGVDWKHSPQGNPQRQGTLMEESANP